MYRHLYLAYCLLASQVAVLGLSEASVDIAYLPLPPLDTFLSSDFQLSDAAEAPHLKLRHHDIMNFAKCTAILQLTLELAGRDSLELSSLRNQLLAPDFQRHRLITG